jgi:hypothetical protein
VRNSKVHLSDSPGYGFGVSAAGLKKFGTQVL